MASSLIKTLGFIYYTVTTTTIMIFLNFFARLSRMPNSQFFISNNIFSKQKLPTTLIKQSVINNSNNINNHKDNMSITNINNYFTNANSNNLKENQKYKLSLGETLLKCDKIVLSTNSSCSPKIIMMA